MNLLCLLSSYNLQYFNLQYSIFQSSKVCFISEGEKFFVSSTVAKGCQLIIVSIRIAREETIDFLLTITVAAYKTTGDQSIDGLQLCTQKLNSGTVEEEWFNPYRRTGGNNAHRGTLGKGRLYRLNGFGTKNLPVFICKRHGF